MHSLGTGEHPCDHQTISKSPSHADHIVRQLCYPSKVSPPIVVKLAFSLRRHIRRTLAIIQSESTTHGTSLTSNGSSVDDGCHAWNIDGVCRRAKYGPSFIGSSSLCCITRQKCKIIGNEKKKCNFLKMRDICLISRDAGHLMKMRDCPSECGTVDTYALPLLKQLHWLPVNYRIKFKLSSLTYRALAIHQPPYLASLLHFSNIPRQLRSSTSQQLSIPRTKLNLGKRAFSVAAPIIWNELPTTLKSCESLVPFHKHLKTYLFKIAFPP